jgi:hypothetical protein
MNECCYVSGRACFRQLLGHTVDSVKAQVQLEKYGIAIIPGDMTGILLSHNIIISWPHEAYMHLT